MHQNERLKITVVMGPFLPMPPAPCGAVEYRWQGVAGEFAKLGHGVTVLCRYYPGQKRVEEMAGVKYVRRMQLTRSRFIYYNILKDLAYTIRVAPALPKSDILITNTFWLPFAAKVKKHGAKVCPNIARVPKGQLFLYRGVDRLYAVSNAIRSEIGRQAPYLLHKTRVVPNPIDAAIFRPTERPRAGIPTVLYTGRIHPEKGLELLIDAFRELVREKPRLLLKIVGPSETKLGGGGEGYVRKLRNSAEGLPVEFCEPVFGRRELAKVYQQAHFYCYPSLAEKGESFGVAPLEAMATGLVPVVSDLPCFRDFIEHGRTGYVFDHRGGRAAHNLADALKGLIDSPQALQMRVSAVEKAQQFSFERIARRFVDDFRQLLSGG